VVSHLDVSDGFGSRVNSKEFSPVLGNVGELEELSLSFSLWRNVSPVLWVGGTEDLEDG